MSIRLGIIQINVMDLNVAWNFYVETLGLAGHRKHGQQRAFELSLPGGPVVLVYPATTVTAHDYPHGTGLVPVLYTDDLNATIARWRARGVTFIPISWAKDDTGIGHSPYGPFIAFRDPFGNVFELLEPRSHS